MSKEVDTTLVNKNSKTAAQDAEQNQHYRIPQFFH